ncbi:hypothetical protein PGTUg99_007611 [Puccinia graminis f. sp. tritici]|uniref:Uncharacterized protein n=1 Tax=Puccinia graminis f. sp. tritici TaxID=56615 RepID=A0A5B0QEK9_PUCGR|nr:hypothetical protein PGTUg99_007611 [Puccinia graminis f. sp. tritici]
MHEAANTIGEKQQVDLNLNSIDIDVEHQQLSGQARITISNLLNPIAPKPPGLSAAFLTERSEDKFQLILTSPDGSKYELNRSLMIDLRKQNDTENRNGHSGNEKRKKQNFLLMAANPSKTNSSETILPSDCSKLVALVLKENTSQQSSISRMHRWNIQVKFNLSEVRNTSTHVDVQTQMLVQGGQITKTNELRYGKYGVIIKDRVSCTSHAPCMYREAF